MKEDRCERYMDSYREKVHTVFAASFLYEHRRICIDEMFAGGSSSGKCGTDCAWQYERRAD